MDSEDKDARFVNAWRTYLYLFLQKQNEVSSSLACSLYDVDLDKYSRHLTLI